MQLITQFEVNSSSTYLVVLVFALVFFSYFDLHSNVSAFTRYYKMGILMNMHLALLCLGKS